MSLVIFVDHLKYYRQREVDADRFAVDLLMNEELPDYKVVLAIVLFPVCYTLRILVRQLQCHVILKCPLLQNCKILSFYKLFLQNFVD